MKKIITLLAVLIMVGTILTGCSNDDTIQTLVISDKSYSTQNALEEATQPETLGVGEAVYASIQFIESPLGMEYSTRWYIDGTEVKRETKATVNNATDIVVYELEADKVNSGTMRFEVLFRDTVLRTQELKIQ